MRMEHFEICIFVLIKKINISVTNLLIKLEFCMFSILKI